ncbi:hypothetical protein A176_000643 [Myxococcus hansupus]|uniref:Uncharacterized protein n=1 Tax=Pseudomyxococcus hansupus TaxID=1297742 RepID=A0A0H4WK44_9BACT|nr:DUF6585 family protein [Myxococcus hansupus]AKQ63731.1 hypothetical protein A176_000643 [Myxococcus hansupus]
MRLPKPIQDASEAPLKNFHTRVFPKPTLYWLAAGGVLIYLVLAAFLSFGGIYLLPADFIKGMFRSHFGPVFMLLGVPCGLYFIFWRASDFIAWMLAPKVLEVGSEGLRAGTTRIAWRNVSAITPVKNHDRLVLKHRGGTYRLRLNLWDDADSLYEYVTDHVVEVLLTGVHRQVAAGKQVPFGPLSLSNAGLTHKKRLMRWDDIENIRFQDEFDQGVSTRELIITADGRSIKVDEARIVNAPVLLAFLSQRLAA